MAEYSPIYTENEWYEFDIPTESQMQQYLDNVAKFRAVVQVASSTPDVPADMQKLTISDANAIEKILVDVEQLLTNMISAWFYSGEIYAGEV